MELDQAIFSEVLEWGRDLDGFKPEHARHALTVVQGYLDGVAHERGRRTPGIGTGDRRRLLLFALDLTWTFWLDEIFDTRSPEDPIDVDSIVEAMRPGGAATTPEARGFELLRSSFSDYRGEGGDYLLWAATAADAIRAWEVERHLATRTPPLSYSEYIENGFNSTAVPHIVTTAALLHGYRAHERLAEQPVRRLLRNLSLSCRLHNDLFSVDKELREGSAANAVLLVRRFTGLEQARAFVADELRGYEEMLRQDVQRLGPADPFARLAVIMPAAHGVLYTGGSEAYRAFQTGVSAGEGDQPD